MKHHYIYSWKCRGWIRVGVPYLVWRFDRVNQLWGGKYDNFGSD